MALATCLRVCIWLLCCMQSSSLTASSPWHKGPAIILRNTCSCCMSVVLCMQAYTLALLRLQQLSSALWQSTASYEPETTSAGPSAAHAPLWLHMHMCLLVCPWLPTAASGRLSDQPFRVQRASVSSSCGPLDIHCCETDDCLSWVVTWPMMATAGPEACQALDREAHLCNRCGRVTGVTFSPAAA